MKTDDEIMKMLGGIRLTTIDLNEVFDGPQARSVKTEADHKEWLRLAGLDLMTSRATLNAAWAKTGCLPNYCSPFTYEEIREARKALLSPRNNDEEE